MSIQIFCRDARKTDARDIARLFRISADGYADYTWSKQSIPGEDLLDVGEARFRREDTEFSYQNCIVAEQGGVIVGLLHSYPVYASSADESIDDARDPVFDPFNDMEEPQSLYIPSLAVHEQWRRMGIGGLLLREAHTRAKGFGLDKLSLVCFSSNTQAMRLYLRYGFVLRKEASVVPHPMILASGRACLMVKE